jgi:hypothetical protein
MRVDGNDVVAVHVATQRARAFIREHGRPVLLETMTYRQGHHSTSDDSTLYRSAEEMRRWTEELNPIDRTKRYLMVSSWDQEADISLTIYSHGVCILYSVKGGSPSRRTNRSVRRRVRPCWRRWRSARRSLSRRSRPCLTMCSTRSRPICRYTEDSGLFSILYTCANALTGDGASHRNKSASSWSMSPSTRSIMAPSRAIDPKRRAYCSSQLQANLTDWETVALIGWNIELIVKKRT